MLRLKLHTHGEQSWLSAGAATLFRFRGGRLCRDYEPDEIASLAGNRWSVGEAYFDNVSFRGAVLVWFENTEGEPSATHGPFEDFSTSDGAAFADGQLFATYRPENALWLDQASGRQWQEMVISSAQEP